MAKDQEKDGRDELRKAADEFSHEVAAFYAEMLKADKTVRATCTCGRKFDVPVADWNARGSALDKLLTHGYGRPGQQREEPKPAATALKDVQNLTDDELAVALHQEGDTVTTALRRAAQRILDQEPGKP